jgi:hypothetical protein
MADTYLKNMKLDNDRKADFRTENPRSAFSFLAVKIAAIPGKQTGKTSRNKNAYPCRPMFYLKKEQIWKHWIITSCCLSPCGNTTTTGMKG